MSRGSPIIPVRIPEGLLHRVDAEIARVNKNTRNAPFSRSSWILAAIHAKLDHSERSRKKRVKKQVPIVRADESAA